jgi:hypothetical protein
MPLHARNHFVEVLKERRQIEEDPDAMGTHDVAVLAQPQYVVRPERSVLHALPAPVRVEQRQTHVDVEVAGELGQVRHIDEILHEDRRIDIYLNATADERLDPVGCAPVRADEIAQAIMILSVTVERYRDRDLRQALEKRNDVVVDHGAVRC